MQVLEEFKDYQLLDMADGMKLEKWGDVCLARPDPQICWSKKENEKIWQTADGIYERSSTGGGSWRVLKKMPASWKIRYESKLGELVFNVKPMGFKHTGLFPEQAINWEYMMKKISEETKKKKEQIKVLNLFAYTGGATVACLKAGASVCHVDSSKGMVEWAKENVKSSKLDEKSVRYIVDDVLKFVAREIKRGNKYDCIIMDPPSYGRGKSNEVWNIEEDIEKLLSLCSKVLSASPLFVVINTYTSGLSGTVMLNVLKKVFEQEDLKTLQGNYITDEIGIMSKYGKYVLPCGITTKWEANEK